MSKKKNNINNKKMNRVIKAIIKSVTKDQLKAGDLVQLKSGGPVMTIRYKVTDSRTVFCCWFVDNEVKDTVFDKNAVVKVSDNK